MHGSGVVYTQVVAAEAVKYLITVNFHLVTFFVQIPVRSCQRSRSCSELVSARRGANTETRAAAAATEWLV